LTRLALNPVGPAKLADREVTIPVLETSGIGVAEQATAECRHHWRIASPNGATSNGTCKLCGAIREFPNSTNESVWDNDHGEGGLGRWRRKNAMQEISVTHEPERPRANLRDLLGRGADVS
jgi:hypothetical protein